MMMKPIRLSVSGLPKPAGSKRGFALKRGGQFTGRVVITDDCKGSAGWKADVREAARRAYSGQPITGVPLSLSLVFNLPRPQGHFRTGENRHLLRNGSPRYPITKPDLLKLTRAVEDALTGIVWHDDSQIVTETLFKRYGVSAPGVEIEIREEQ